MLDLEPIKARLAAATPGPWRASHNVKPLNAAAVAEVNTIFILPDCPLYGSPAQDADLIANAPTDLAALVAEVERLRYEAHVNRQNLTAMIGDAERLGSAIARHRQRMVIDPQPWDRDLWAVLDA